MDEDEDSIDDLINLPSRITPASFTKISIVDLFDFGNPHWTEQFLSSALRTYQEELEFYEMLNLHADGDMDVEVDETTAQTLRG